MEYVGLYAFNILMVFTVCEKLCFGNPSFIQVSEKDDADANAAVAGLFFASLGRVATVWL